MGGLQSPRGSVVLLWVDKSRVETYFHRRRPDVVSVGSQKKLRQWGRRSPRTRRWYTRDGHSRKVPGGDENTLGKRRAGLTRRRSGGRYVDGRLQNLCLLRCRGQCEHSTTARGGTVTRGLERTNLEPDEGGRRPLRVEAVGVAEPKGSGGTRTEVWTDVRQTRRI